ncbi:MAG TPA: hypothetical protein VJ946_03350 [Bacteroidales bacterium]|nr:hypothetical protein [Bacteroidales bacterium]
MARESIFTIIQKRLFREWYRGKNRDAESGTDADPSMDAYLKKEKRRSNFRLLVAVLIAIAVAAAIFFLV